MCEATRPPLDSDVCQNGHPSNSRCIDNRRRSVAALFLLFHSCNASYSYSESSGWHADQLGCFVHGSNRHLQVSLIQLGSTKEEYYDVLQDEVVKKRRQKGIQHQNKARKKRNKLLREHLKVQIATTDYNDARKSKRRRKQHARGSKALSTSTVAQIITSEGTEHFSPTQSMPPWLARYEQEDFEQYNYDQEAAISEAPPKSISDEMIAAQKLKKLEQAMSGVFEDDRPHSTSIFSSNEIYDVLDSIRVSSQNNVNLIIGCADFLYLMLSLEENDEVRDIKSDLNDVLPRTLIMTRDVLVAAAFHYCDCVRARKGGVYDVVKAFMEAGGSGRLIQNQRDKQQQQHDNLMILPSVSNNSETVEETAIVMTKKTIHRRGKSPIEKYGEETVRIAAGAAKLKRAEVMATTVNTKYDSDKSRVRRKSITADNLSVDASILRSFLVSLSEDWRALVIRSAACLYRLRGIVDEENNSINNGRLVYSTTSMQTARDALKVYAPLAQRMGMQRLKSQIENTAFRILYPRQYDVSSALHDRDLVEMNTIIQVLTSRIEQLLMSDSIFMANIDNISVSSRVKEPYSLWKKILRYRKEAVKQSRATGSGSTFMPPTLSTRWVPDAIALRVILRGKQMPMEDEESLRTREKMLCYFALQMISDVWPASEANVAKDYIKHPKPNRYQSLHYTAALIINGDEWPFEVQIRSEEMHRIAEYGVAAHWDYKLQRKMPNALGDGTHEKPLALPASIDAELAIEPSIELNDIITEAPSVASKDRVGSYIDALTTSRESLVKNNVFIFISSTESALDGRIISLDPTASLCSDVFKQYGGNVTHKVLKEIVLYRNGIRISLNDHLTNGDVLTLTPEVIDMIEF